MQIEIDGTLQTILFHRIPEKKNDLTNRAPIDSDFSGSVYSTDVNGRIISGASMRRGAVTRIYDYPSSTIDPPIKLDEVLIPGYVKPILPPTNDAITRMDYQFVRTQNNSATMGIAYYGYYTSKAIKEINDEIFADKLPPCLKNILNDLKLTNASPGNMITKFSGNNLSSDYNWRMEPGRIAPDVVANTLTDTYNTRLGIKTIFDYQQYPNATELSWARTILHESIHAYLVSYYYRNEPGFKAEYPILYQSMAKQNYGMLISTTKLQLALLNLMERL